MGYAEASGHGGGLVRSANGIPPNGLLGENRDAENVSCEPKVVDAAPGSNGGYQLNIQRQFGSINKGIYRIEATPCGVEPSSHADT